MSMCVSIAQARTKCARRAWGPAFFHFNFQAKWLLCAWGQAFFLYISTCQSAFRPRRLAQSVLPGLGVGFPPLCSRMCALLCALICVLSPVLSHQYVCSHDAVSLSHSHPQPVWGLLPFFFLFYSPFLTIWRQKKLRCRWPK